MCSSDLSAALLIPLLLRNRHRLSGKPDRLPQLGPRDLSDDRSRLPGISAGRAPALPDRPRSLLQRLLLRRVSDTYPQRNQQTEIRAAAFRERWCGQLKSPGPTTPEVFYFRCPQTILLSMYSSPLQVDHTVHSSWSKQQICPLNSVHKVSIIQIFKA